MATPTAICPVCFVRFPATESSSTPTSCPACAHKFAAPVRDDDEPVAADLVDDSGEDDVRTESPREPRPGQAKRVKAARTGFRRRDGEVTTADEDRSPTLTPLVMLGLVFGAASLLCVVIVLLVVSLSSPDRSGDVAEWTPEPVKPFVPNPEPEPVRPNPNPNPNPNPDPVRPNPDPVRPNPDPVRPPIGPPVVPFPEDPFNPGPVFPNVPPVKPLPPERPKEKMKLPAVTPVALTAAPLTEDSTEVKLPGTVTDACVGGGGRYYCLLLGDKKQVAVFDVCAAKVAKYLPVAGDGAKIAANMNKLLVVYPDNNLVTRYDLTTFEKEATLKLPFDGKVKVVAMGSASAGPLLVQHQQGNGALDSAPVSYLDPIKLTPFDLPGAAGGRGGASVRDAMHFRASPDGTVFGVWATSHSPTGLGSTVLTDGGAKTHYEHDSVGHIVPGPDGTLYTLMGRYTPNLKKKGDKVAGFCLPAAGGNLFFTLSADGPDNGMGGFPGREVVKQKADIKMDGDARSLVTLKDLPGAPTDAWAGHDFTADKRYLLVPDAKAFVALAATNDKLIVRKFDVIASMEASGVDYLFVSSRPTGVKPGEPYSYQIETKSKKGGVSYTLDAGPDGLKVSPAGRVTWAVPKGYAGGDTVVITVADKSGQQVFHTFELKERADAAVAVGPQPPVPVEPPPVVDPPKPPVAVVPGPKADPDQVVMAPAKPFPMPRTKLTEKTAVALPDSADAMCLGGGGRFVLYRLPKTKQLAVVDLCEGKVAKYIPLAEANATFAAGMDKVFVYNPSADVFQRWSLTTFEKEATVKNPVGGTPTRLLMGHSTDGPLYVGGNKVNTGGYALLHPTTFKTVDLKADGGGRGGPAITDWYPPIVRVSGDGRVYGWHSVGLSPAGFHSMVISGKTAKCYHEHTTVSPIVPGPDGTLFTGGGLYTPDQKAIGDKPTRRTYGGGSFPATAAPWLVRMNTVDPFGGATGKEKGKNELVIGLVGEPQVSLPLTDHEGYTFAADAGRPRPPVRGGSGLELTDRFVLNPPAGVLAILTEGGDKVFLHPLDLKALLAKGGGDYLMVMSQPPAAAKGQKWTYTPDVWSKTGKAVVKVETGPAGMTATGGTVTWTVPKDFAESETQVILTVTDGGKQETFHTFALPVTTATAVGPQPPIPVEPPPVVVDPPKLPKTPLVVPWPGAKADPNQVVMAPAKPFPIPRTKITEKTAVALPDSADAMCLGGGGRFVLYRLPKTKQLAVLDLCEGKVAKYIPLAEANASFAAGMSKVYVYNPSADVFQRWSLETFEKEATVKNPVGGSPKRLLMGHSTDGPLCATGNDAAFTFLNPTTFKTVDLKAEGGRGGFGGWAATVRVSGDGRVYGWHSPDVSPQGFYSMVISGKTAKNYHQHSTPWHVAPGPDGTLFTGFGIFTPEQKPVNGKFVDTYPNPVTVPATAAPWYLRVTYADRFGGAKDKEKNEVAVALVGDTTVRLLLADHEGFQFPAESPHPAHIGRGTPFHDLDRFVLNPQAGVLAVINGTGNKVHLHPLDLKALLAKGGGDYLMVMSQPPAAAKGQKWTYTPDVWSKTGKAVVKVETGPAGMTATGGTVTWTVPKDFAESETQVILTVTDGGKQETFHTFALPVGPAK